MLLLICLVPAFLFVATWWQRPHSSEVTVRMNVDGSFEVAGERGTLKEITPALQAEVARRQHLQDGAVLNVVAERTLSRIVELIPAATNNGEFRISDVKTEMVAPRNTVPSR
ncbi:MAG: hypothetical protein KDB23_29260 [Planctomycetales bacterium]|nr:hypothetical protein [Planctomycetales bacterium]